MSDSGFNGNTMKIIVGIVFSVYTLMIGWGVSSIVSVNSTLNDLVTGQAVQQERQLSIIGIVNNVIETGRDREERLRRLELEVLRSSPPRNRVESPRDAN